MEGIAEPSRSYRHRLEWSKKEMTDIAEIDFLIEMSSLLTFTISSKYSVLDPQANGKARTPRRIHPLKIK